MFCNVHIMALLSPVLQWCPWKQVNNASPLTEEPESDREADCCFQAARGLRGQALLPFLRVRRHFRKVSLLLGDLVYVCVNWENWLNDTEPCPSHSNILWDYAFIVLPFHSTKLSTMCLKRWGQKEKVFDPQLLLIVYLQTEGKGKELPKLNTN